MVAVMYEKLRRLVPSQDRLRANRWLRWLGPALHHPRLWQMKRRSVALGAGIGVFFAFIIPVAQIPLSVGTAVMLRANVPIAVASTLVNNPMTFGPVYYAAWRVGCVVLNEDPDEREVPAMHQGRPTAHAAASDGSGVSLWRLAANKVASLGKPMIVGATSFAVGFGLLAYAAVMLGWRWRVTNRRRRRLMGGLHS